MKPQRTGRERSGLLRCFFTTAAPLAAAVFLVSCGIRLPVTTRAEFPAALPVSAHAIKREAFVSSENDPDILVWMIADGFHTGMVFPYDWLLESGYIPPKGFKHTRFVTMSWGNTDAYSVEGIGGFPGLCRVLFSPTPSVMELIAFDWNPAEVSPRHRIYRRLTPRSHGPALAAFLNGCAVAGPDGTPVVVRPASWGRGVQLQGKYPYFIPRVCNVWTAQSIEAIGGKMNPWFGLTADGLIRQAERPPNNFEKIWSGGGMNPDARMLPRTGS